MNHRDVTPEQASKIKTALFPNLNYLMQLKSRMERTGSAWFEDRPERG